MLFHGKLRVQSYSKCFHHVGERNGRFANWKAVKRDSFSSRWWPTEEQWGACQRARQWGPCQRAATSVLRNCCFIWCAEQSQGQFPLLRCWGTTETKEVQLSEPSSTSLFLISSGLSRGSSTTSLLLISPGPANETNFLRESPAHLPPLDLAWTLSYTRRTLFLVYCSNTVKLTSKRHQISSVSCSLQIRHTSSCRHYLTEFCYRSECLITRVWCSSVLFFSCLFLAFPAQA